MIRKFFIAGALLWAHQVQGQAAGDFITDSLGGCKIWAPGHGAADVVRWTGGCSNGLAEGKGTWYYYSGATPVMQYEGNMHRGQCSGQGKLQLPGGIVKEGHFSESDLDGEGTLIYDNRKRKTSGTFVKGMLNLDKGYRERLHKHIIAETDTANMYVGDGEAKQLFYTILSPARPVKGVLVLLPGTWETVEHAIGSTRTLCQLAADKGIAVIFPSVNQRLVMNEAVLSLLNTMLDSAVKKYNLPRDRFVMGGWSMGGLFSLRYAELSVAEPGKTVIRPRAVMSVDGPADLETLYRNSARSFKARPAFTEPKYILEECTRYLGGAPDSFRLQYVGHSTFSRSEADGGNAKYLAGLPVRIYNDVDVNWWIDNRGRDLYDMNALDQSAMINQLRKMGNTRAEFINAYGEGFRLEGNRHPHSWSIVAPADFIAWMEQWIQ